MSPSCEDYIDCEDDTSDNTYLINKLNELLSKLNLLSYPREVTNNVATEINYSPYEPVATSSIYDPQFVSSIYDPQFVPSIDDNSIDFNETDFSTMTLIDTKKGYNELINDLITNLPTEAPLYDDMKIIIQNLDTLIILSNDNKNYLLLNIYSAIKELLISVTNYDEYNSGTYLIPTSYWPGIISIISNSDKRIADSINMTTPTPTKPLIMYTSPSTMFTIPTSSI
jgi:hypothetical protein